MGFAFQRAVNNPETDPEEDQNCDRKGHQELGRYSGSQIPAYRGVYAAHGPGRRIVNAPNDVCDSDQECAKDRSRCPCDGGFQIVQGHATKIGRVYSVSVGNASKFP